MQAIPQKALFGSSSIAFYVLRGDKGMKIQKVINNNLVRSFNEVGTEVLVMGCGLGFKKQINDDIDESLIEKIYIISNKTIESKLAELFENIPVEHIRVANMIIEYAKKTLDKELKDNIYITLTDHIDFALERLSKGLPLKNALLWEIKNYYHSEYLVGKEAIEIVKRELGFSLPEDEAGFIAFHLVEASINNATDDYVKKAMAIIQNVLNIVKYYFSIDFDENSLTYERFLVHLKFFTERILNNNIDSPEVDDNLFELVKKQFPNEYACTLKIQKYFLESMKIRIPENELTYLTIHIKRITEKKKGEKNE